MKLIVGLGNPELKYLNTKHNIGFKVIDALTTHFKTKLDQKKFDGIFVKLDHVILAKPLTYMNLSGHFVSKIIKYFKIKLEDVVIVYDEVRLNIGVVKIKKEGGANGHNGLKSILEFLPNKMIGRLKIGIGPLPLKANLEHFVLTPFTTKQIEVLEKKKHLIVKALLTFIDQDIEASINLINNFNSQQA